MAKDKSPDKCTHSTESPLPFGVDLGLLDPIHKTKIEKDGETYTGYGWTEKESNKNAGEKYNKGQKDRK